MTGILFDPASLSPALVRIRDAGLAEAAAWRAQYPEVSRAAGDAIDAVRISSAGAAAPSRADLQVPAGLPDFFERPWNHQCAECDIWFCDIRANRRFCSRCRKHGARTLQRRGAPDYDKPLRMAFDYELCSEGSEDPWYYKGDKHRNGARTKEHNAHDIAFVGIDGEGISIRNEKGEIIDHNYVL